MELWDPGNIDWSLHLVYKPGEWPGRPWVLYQTDPQGRTTVAGSFKVRGDGEADIRKRLGNQNRRFSRAAVTGKDGKTVSWMGRTPNGTLVFPSRAARHQAQMAMNFPKSGIRPGEVYSLDLPGSGDRGLRFGLVTMAHGGGHPTRGMGTGKQLSQLVTDAWAANAGVVEGKIMKNGKSQNGKSVQEITLAGTYATVYDALKAAAKRVRVGQIVSTAWGRWLKRAVRKPAKGSKQALAIWEQVGAGARVANPGQAYAANPKEGKFEQQAYLAGLNARKDPNGVGQAYTRWSADFRPKGHGNITMLGWGRISDAFARGYAESHGKATSANPTGAGYMSGGVFHPVRSWSGYDPVAAGEAEAKPKRRRAKTAKGKGKGKGKGKTRPRKTAKKPATRPAARKLKTRAAARAKAPRRATRATRRLRRGSGRQ